MASNEDKHNCPGDEFPFANYLRQLRIINYSQHSIFAWRASLLPSIRCSKKEAYPEAVPADSQTEPSTRFGHVREWQKLRNWDRGARSNNGISRLCVSSKTKHLLFTSSCSVITLPCYVLLKKKYSRTQCMIRWQRSNMISLKKVVEYEVAGQRIAPEPPFHFFDLITKPHRIENGIVRWDGPEIPMQMGIYEARVTKDFEKYYAPMDTSVDLSGGRPDASTSSSALADLPIDGFLKRIPIQLYPLTVNPLPSGPLPVLPVQVHLLVPLRPGDRSLPLKEFQTYEAERLDAGFPGQTEQGQTEQGQTGLQTQQPYPSLQGQMGQGEMRYQVQEPHQGSQGQTQFQWQPPYEWHQASQQQ